MSPLLSDLEEAAGSGIVGVPEESGVDSFSSTSAGGDSDLGSVVG